MFGLTTIANYNNLMKTSRMNLEDKQSELAMLQNKYNQQIKDITDLKQHLASNENLLKLNAKAVSATNDKLLYTNKQLARLKQSWIAYTGKLDPAKRASTKDNITGAINDLEKAMPKLVTSD